ncbi:phage antirepressor KilAC domain-containing protein [Acidithiobacillus sp. IBUN Pt1247-S3]|uniref:phage antirepressor KilAC domain-containing protein n=1 Tax=Acidithiobacillus sp. IBUN Pt1247-S3 TaxID=3166642 RepID=UPI0034E5F0CA
MSELIPVSSRAFGDSIAQTVNARDLHAFLEVGKVFAAWIQDRIQQFGFVENQDFVILSEIGKNSHGRGQPKKEYALTLDMAKELSMVERNEKGKQARLYFIECERRAKAAPTVAPDPIRALSDPASLRGLLLTYTERVLALEAEVQEQAPKARFHDAVAEAINAQSIQEVAKALRTGPNRLFKFLRDAGILMHNNLPYQQYLDAGHFRVVEKQYFDRHGESNTYTRTLVTGKGLTYIQKRLQDGQILMDIIAAEEDE